MPVNIYIQDNHVNDMIEFYNSKLKGIKQRKSELDKEESSIKAIIMQLKSKKTESTSDEIVIHSDVSLKNIVSYQHKWIWAKKIDFAIWVIGKPATTNEIVDTLLIYQPNLERKRAVASVSSILSVKAGEPEDESKPFIRIDDGTGIFKFFIKKDINIEKEMTIHDFEDRVNDISVSIKKTFDNANDLPF